MYRSLKDNKSTDFASSGVGRFPRGGGHLAMLQLWQGESQVNTVPEVEVGPPSVQWERQLELLEP